MDLEYIKQASTYCIGKNVQFYKTIDSTQQEAKRKMGSKTKNGTIFIADQQTKGIGTHERKWHTGKGNNIACTIVLYPKCRIQEIQTLTIDIAKAMQKTIEALYQIPLAIKLPNDLMLHGKKIGGILTQASTKGEKVHVILIGVGFNVNEEYFPEEIHTIVTSLKKEYNQEFSREEILRTFIEILEKEVVYLHLQERI